MSNDDFFVEDLFENNSKKKKINSGIKGKDQERQLAKIFNERFKEILAKNPKFGMFSRSVGSGNRYSQAVLSEVAKQVYSGDLTCPEVFLFVVESKKGYNEIDLNTAFTGECGDLDEFLKQVSEDASRVGKRPLLIWKKDRKPAIAFFRMLSSEIMPNLTYCFAKLKYKDWTAVSLDDLLSMPDNFWFET
jgi:hypothetical protein